MCAQHTFFTPFFFLKEGGLLSFNGKKDPDLLSSDHDAVKDDRETKQD